jgi:hypothetical protein
VEAQVGALVEPAVAERSARRIVLRPWPVRRTICLIDNRLTKKVFRSHAAKGISFQPA